MIMKFYFLLLSFFFATCTDKKSNTIKVSLPDFFDAHNWEVTNNSDTFYIFFSPVHDILVETYEYKIANGDSVHTQKNAIQIFNDSLKWKFKENIYTVTHIDSNKISLEFKNIMYHLNKISDDLMVLESFNDSFYFRRTLPISTFLVRRKYDYLNGTSGADSAEVLPRKMRKHNKL